MPKFLEHPREHILEHANYILYDEGYEKLSIRNVAKSCGLAVGTIYNYFPTKENLIIELMGQYWEKYFMAIEEIDHNEKDFYIKLKKIYNEFKKFVDIFHENWIKPNSYKFSKKKGLKRKKDLIERLIERLEIIILQYFKENKMDSNEISKFIILNFMMMAQMKDFSYDSFEKIIIKVLK